MSGGSADFIPPPSPLPLPHIDFLGKRSFQDEKAHLGDSRIPNFPVHCQISWSKFGGFIQTFSSQIIFSEQSKK